jgi:predicted RNA binding protein YcfA (HicA-like mRNA interferase family)
VPLAVSERPRARPAGSRVLQCREAAELLSAKKELGLEFHRLAAGSHEIWFNPALNRCTTIPNHPGDMPEGTLSRRPQAAGIEPETFLQAK